MKIVKQIIATLFGLMFINSGLNKFFSYMPMPELTPQQQEFFTAFMKIGWLQPLGKLLPDFYVYSQKPEL